MNEDKEKTIRKSFTVSYTFHFLLQGGYILYVNVRFGRKIATIGINSTNYSILCCGPWKPYFQNLKFFYVIHNLAPFFCTSIYKSHISLLCILTSFQNYKLPCFLILFTAALYRYHEQKETVSLSSLSKHTAKKGGGINLTHTIILGKPQVFYSV